MIRDDIYCNTNKCLRKKKCDRWLAHHKDKQNNPYITYLDDIECISKKHNCFREMPIEEFEEPKPFELKFRVTTPTGEVYDSDEDELIIFNNQVFIREFDCETSDDFIGDKVEGKLEILTLKITEDQIK